MRKVNIMVIVSSAQHATQLLRERPKVTDKFAFTVEVALPLALHMAKFMNQRKISYTITRAQDQSAFNCMYVVSVSSTGKSAVHDIHRMANELARRSQETTEIRAALEENRRPNLRKRGHIAYRILRFKLRTR